MDALQGRDIDAAGLLPRGQRRGAHPALQRDAPSPSTGHDEGGVAASHRRRERDAPPRSGGGGRDHRHERALRAAAARARPARWTCPTREPDDGRQRDQLWLQVRRSARGGHGLRRALHGEPVLHRPSCGRSTGSTRPCASSSWPAGHRALPRLRDTSSSTSRSRASAEGKSRLTVAIGCTGGLHRSVAIAEAVRAACASGQRPGQRLAPRARANVTDAMSHDGGSRRRVELALSARERAGCAAGCSRASASSAGWWWSSSGELLLALAGALDPAAASWSSVRTAGSRPALRPR